MFWSELFWLSLSTILSSLVKIMHMIRFVFSRENWLKYWWKLGRQIQVLVVFYFMKPFKYWCKIKNFSTAVIERLAKLHCNLSVHWKDVSQSFMADRLIRKPETKELTTDARKWFILEKVWLLDGILRRRNAKKTSRSEETTLARKWPMGRKKKLKIFNWRCWRTSCKPSVAIKKTFPAFLFFFAFSPLVEKPSSEDKRLKRSTSCASSWWPAQVFLLHSDCIFPALGPIVRLHFSRSLQTQIPYYIVIKWSCNLKQNKKFLETIVWSYTRRVYIIWRESQHWNFCTCFSSFINLIIV